MFLSPRSADIDAWSFASGHLYPPQGVRSAFIDLKSIEIGNADVAANVLGCAAKVPSFSVSPPLYYFAGNIKLRPECIRSFMHPSA